VRALYGLHGSGAAFQNHLLAKLMTDLGFRSCKADPDVWMRKATTPEGSYYYEYVLYYVDDTLVVSIYLKSILQKGDKYFPMKPNLIAVPDIYLGAKISKAKLPNGTEAWAMISSDAQEAIKNVKCWLVEREQKVPTRCSTPLPMSYCPELDILPELDATDANYYQSVIDILRWAIELSWVDIMTEVSMLTSHLALPREGHLVGTLQVFAYLEKKHNARMVFDPTYPIIDRSVIPTHDWKYFYGNVKEAIPPNAP
jgi:hypothetical protein